MCELNGNRPAPPPPMAGQAWLYTARAGTRHSALPRTHVPLRVRPRWEHGRGYVALQRGFVPATGTGTTNRTGQSTP